ncbi:MAG: hypothetical protein OEZ01_01550 [Candidatus Heimdallarchaeota archaeon]|nr:hypothetical protein [Candidatus Heimdallarchaeota archaeon]MDH5644659.1 hypothetical protein [Candidatus Heimdallarchaeota archaeon]
MKQRYESMKYLFYSTISLSSLAFIFILPEFINPVVTYFVYLPIVLLTQILAFYFYYIFLETFDHNNVLTRNNILIGFIVIISITTMMITSIPVIIEMHNIDEFSSLSNVLSILPSQIGNYIFYTFIISSIFTFVLTLFFGYAILNNLNQKIQSTPNIDFKKIIKMIRIGVIIMLLGIILPTKYGSFITIFGMTVILRHYISNSIQSLQSGNIKRLIIIDTSGIPVFTYRFDENGDNSLKNSKIIDEEILFSGGFRAISLLLSEFFGKELEIHEIKLNSVDLLINPIDKEFYVIMITGKSTIIAKEMLKFYSIQFQNEFISKSNSSQYEIQTIGMNQLNAVFGSTS